MEKIDIRYVAAPPGTGKTKAAVEFMRRHIIKGLKGQDAGYMFYVAPTIELLEQTLQYLSNTLKTKKAKDCLFLEVTSKRKDLPPVKQRILNLLSGTKASNLHPRPFGNGCILFLTHPAFVELGKHPIFERTTVLFDEARKWTEMSKKMKMPPDVEELFLQLFYTTPVRDKKRIAMVHPKVIPGNKLAQFVRTKDQGKAFPYFEELHKNLTSDQVRMKVYRMMRGTSMGKTMVQITLPSNPFKGFKRVYILSADFVNSQMYHLLAKEGNRPKKVTEEFMNKYLKGGYYQALETIRKRHDHLIIAPLLDTNRMPSISMLHEGMVIPKDKVDGFLTVIDDLDITSEELKDLSVYVQSPERADRPNKLQAKLLKFMEDNGCRFDVLKWQLAASRRIAKQWLKKHPKDGRDARGILMVNKDYEGKFSSVDDVLEYVSVGKVEGSNVFIKRNLVVFLAGINPTPELKDVLSAEIPEYDPDEDYAIDKAIQCLGRGNIRDHASKEPMLAIVPTSHLAERVYKRMAEQPRIDLSYCEKLGNYTIWNTKEARNERGHLKRAKLSPEQAEKARVAKNKAYQETFFADDTKKLLHTAKQNLNYYMKKSPLTSKHKAKIEELKSRITQLQRKLA